MTPCDKKKFVEFHLLNLLLMAGADVTELKLTPDGEYVDVIFTDGYKKRACIACDSRTAIIRDVMRVVD